MPESVIKQPQNSLVSLVNEKKLKKTFLIKFDVEDHQGLPPAFHRVSIFPDKLLWIIDLL